VETVQQEPSVAPSTQRPEQQAGPRAEYVHRLEDRYREATRLARRERIVGNARVFAFLSGLAIAWLVFRLELLSAWWLVVPVLAFGVLLFVHERVTRAWHRAGRAFAYYQHGLARVDGTWEGKGPTGQRFQDPKHPYAADLDLFGNRSLFELLCTARTRTGEDTLAAWLKTAASADEVRARQEAVAELAPQLDLREDLALLGEPLREKKKTAEGVPELIGVDFEGVARWGAAEPVLTNRLPRLVALVLGILGLTTLYGFLFSGWAPSLFVGTIFVDLAFSGFLYKRINGVLAEVEKRARDLALLASVLARLEAATFQAPRLAELKAILSSGPDDTPPSQRIAQLGNLLELLNSRKNQLFAPFAYIMHWGTQMAYAIEAWRAQSGKAIAGWLAAVGQFEALCALATYSYENPDDPFPEVVAGEAVYDGEGLGHPLLAASQCVRNDLNLGGDLRVLIVSGSNMSGKSTFLRTVGINAVLGLAGAPVRAKRLRLSPLAVGATLRIQDSLQEGKSRFKAELERVKEVVELSRGSMPLLFLLDEIFAGTNSHDRGQGAESLVRGLVQTGALGLVTTHDLSLTHIADRLGARGANVHFADRFDEGVMKFDFCLRPGVVQHSNALALMRAVGLDV
jgi:hypothetical protein